MTNIQLPCWRQAIRPACPSHAPLGALPTSQFSPSAGLAGGKGASPSMAQWSRASASACASLTKASFCACPACVAMLRAAQGLRLARRIERGLGAGRPCQQPARRFEARPLAPWRNRQQSALALDHHAAGLPQRCRDQRNPGSRIGFGDGAYPFRSGAGLAKAAPGHDQPAVPLAVGRQSPGSSPAR
jgi:hypothetical protein